MTAHGASARPITAARAVDPLSPAALAASPLRTAWWVLLAGCVATVIFDLYGQAISPLIGGASLAPVPLARQSLQVLLGVDSEGASHLLHYVAGLVAYPLGWLLIARPLAARLLPQAVWLPASILYGVALWVFAIEIMASIIAGNPFFLGFTGITWVALAGHVIFAVAAAWVLERLARPAV